MVSGRAGLRSAAVFQAPGSVRDRSFAVAALADFGWIARHSERALEKALPRIGTRKTPTRLATRTRYTRSMARKASVVIEKDEHGFYAWCPELKGCQSQGDSLEEAMANI